MRLFCVGEKRVLTVRMHGWRSGVTRADASRQVFWVFREAGVKRIISEGGVGTVNKLLDLRDFIIPDDYLDLSVRKDVMLDGRYLLVMRDALCPEMREALIKATKKRFTGRRPEHCTRGLSGARDRRLLCRPLLHRQLRRGHPQGMVASGYGGHLLRRRTDDRRDYPRDNPHGRR